MLYGQGGFYEPEAVLAQLVIESERDPGRVALIGEVFGQFAYKRPAPEHAWAPHPASIEALAANYALFDQSYARGAASALVELGESFVSGALLYTASSTGVRLVYETHRSNDRPYVAPAPEPFGVGAATVSAGTDALFFLGSAGSSNYGHWLVDDLPRLRGLAVLRATGRSERIRILLTSFGYAIDRVRMASLRHYCEGLGEVDVEMLHSDRTYRFERLLYVTPATYHPVLKSPQALGFLSDAFRHVTPTAAKPLRIFVPRRGTRSRVLLNNAEVDAVLSRMGFVTVDVEQMDFAAQASTFAAAQVVVGCMGAAMTNTVFCGPGTQVVHLAPEGWQEPFYWDIAAVQRHRYSVLFGELEPGDQPAHLRSFRIDIPGFEARLGMILS